MLTSLTIENFKCFQKLAIGRLGRVNLFVGESNSGKTAVLEALQYLQPLKGIDWKSWFRPDLGIDISGKLSKWLFHNLDATHEIFIGGTTDQEGSSAGVILDPQDPPISLHDSVAGPAANVRAYRSHGSGDTDGSGGLRISKASTSRRNPTELARAYDQWTLRPSNETRFVDWLKSVDPRVKSLRPMEHTGTRMLYADIGLPERIALPLLGEGFNRLIEILGAMIGEDAQIVLIDEIENGIHWKAFPKMWGGIKKALELESAQVFATTHSIECISAAAETFASDPPGELAVHRLERNANGEIVAVTMHEDELNRMIERGWEVR